MVVEAGRSSMWSNKEIDERLGSVLCFAAVMLLMSVLEGDACSRR